MLSRICELKCLGYRDREIYWWKKSEVVVDYVFLIFVVIFIVVFLGVRVEIVFLSSFYCKVNIILSFYLDCFINFYRVLRGCYLFFIGKEIKIGFNWEVKNYLFEIAWLVIIKC